MIFFSQSAGDIQYILHLYNKCKDKKNIIIYVINVQNNYKFFRSLKLEAKVEFIPLVSQRKVYHYLIHILKLRIQYKKKFENISDKVVYFFSNCSDYVTFSLIEKLSINNNIIFLNVYKETLIEEKSISNSIKKEIMFHLLGINVYFSKYAYVYILDRKINQENMKVDVNRLYPYKYEVICKENNKKNLILFESNSGLSSAFNNYTRDLIKVIDALSMKYNIYIKPHPRLGYSRILNSCNVAFIEEYIPSELLELKRFDLLLGIETTSIVTTDFASRYCLINLFEYNDLSRKKYIVEYLNKLSEGNVTFVKSLDQLIASV